MPGPQRRDQILDACRSVVDSEGFHAVSVDRIAKLCAVTRPVIYQQFGGLAGMLVALVDRETFRAGRGFFEATGGFRVDATVRPRDVVAGVLAAVDADPATWRMFLMPSEGGPPELYERLAQSRSAVRAYVAEALLTRTNMVPDTDVTARMIHAASDEIVRLRLSAPDIYTVERLLAQVDWLESLLTGRTADR